MAQKDTIAYGQVAPAISYGEPANGNPWMEYFGPPAKEIKVNAYDKYANETYDLPEAYKGKNLWLRDTIDGFIVDDSDQWYTTYALPWAQTDDLHVKWNKWTFNRGLAGRVPHEGIPRLITSTKQSHSETIERRGLAFILEHQFMKTPEGIEQYRRNIQGIAQTVQVRRSFYHRYW